MKNKGEMMTSLEMSIYNAKRYQKNKEAIKARSRAYYQEHKKRMREIQRKYKAQNKEKYRAYAKKYREENTTKQKVYQEKYRGKEMMDRRIFCQLCADTGTDRCPGWENCKYREEVKL